MSVDIRKDIEGALKNFGTGSVVANATKLFQTLGYNTERSLSLPHQTYPAFKESFVGDAARFDEGKALVSQWKKVDLLFQLTKEEVLKQTSLFDTKRVDRTLIEAYLFFAIELKEPAYTRTQLSEITRQVNRLFAMPAMIVFQYGNLLTLSVINRRLHKRDESKDVLEKVTLIKDINTDNPHRGHTKILFDLSFDELQDRYGLSNFVELHNAWQKTLDTKTLNKKFFNELSNWYHWAQDYVAFPKQKDVTEEENKQLNLIRLITRLIFVWFLKEKGLVQDDLFRKDFVDGLLKKFDPEGETTTAYYTAILQNLFFATLNQSMGQREFVKETGGFHKDDHGIKNQYRYADQFTMSKEEVKRLFSNIPFLNGGLFDCLDKDNDETGKHEYVDGFSREPKKRAKASDVLFFGKERKVDLSEAYGYKRKEDNCRGLLEIFHDYKFTVEENTPVEEEIALDPELLGRVFENLLAYYAPETKTTARKQTGSFYTPREIVEYMVDESLIAYLKTALLTVSPAYLEFGKTQTDMFGNGGRKGQLHLTETLAQSPWEGREEELEEALRLLLHYNNKPHPFAEAEVDQLIFAIDNCKILDPACGSGAFPMGILNKLVYLLRKLDAEDVQGNTRWRSLQKRKAEIALSGALNEKDKLQREKKLVEINETFENNASDYGRKLYLIENCVYGVDIQPIAVQISKLRFFISLVVDQKERASADNRGIRPLPNLETKFVAANTLIGLENLKASISEALPS